MRQRRDRGETLEDVRRRPASLVASLGLVLAVLAALVAGPAIASACGRWA